LAYVLGVLTDIGVVLEACGDVDAGEFSLGIEVSSFPGAIDDESLPNPKVTYAAWVTSEKNLTA